MKLKLALKKTLATESNEIFPHGCGFVLVDEDGRVLPCQRDVVIDQGLNEATTVKVTFVVDGRGLILDEKLVAMATERKKE